MSTSDSHDQHTDQRDTQDPGRPSHQDLADDAQLSEEGRKEIRRMAEACKDKPTVTLPGTHGTISGTAINEWLDDEGNPKFGDPNEHPFAEGESPGDNPHYPGSDVPPTSAAGHTCGAGFLRRWVPAALGSCGAGFLRRWVPAARDVDRADGRCCRIGMQQVASGSITMMCGTNPVAAPSIGRVLDGTHGAL